MRRYIILLCALLAAFAAEAEQRSLQRARALYDRYEQLRPAVTTGIAMLRPAADGGHFYGFDRQNGIGIYAFADTSRRVTVPVQALEGIDLRGYEVSPAGVVMVFDGSRPIYRHSFTTECLLYDGGALRPIIADVDDKRDASFSPDGATIAFSSGNDLWLYDIASDKARRITRDGEWNAVINGTTDWVYEEEFGFTRAYAFSPDSRRIAYLRFDESRVPLFEMMRYDSTLYNRTYEFKYPKAGDTNSTVTLHVYDMASDTMRTIDTGTETDMYIPHIGWTPAGDLYFFRVNRKQNLFEVVLESGCGQKVIYREQSPRYVERVSAETVHFIDGKHFIVREETSAGWWHLYLYSTDKGLVRQLTSGEWEVTQIAAATDKYVWYISTEASPLRRDLYRIDLKGKDKRRLSGGDGWYSVVAGEGMEYYVSTYTSAAYAGRIDICRGDGTTVRQIAAAKPLTEQAPRREFFTWTTERGDTLNAYMIRPRDFDAAKRYPVLITQYSGPGSQEVADRWRPDWCDMLADEGYIVVCTDTRGTGFRGEAFKKVTYGNLGALECEDMISFARHMQSQPYVDASRIGIYGWSYGGFMALSCAFRGGSLFRMAIAVAPVASWRFYDSIYTEIYNDLPQDNPSGYDDNSPINFAEGLSDDTRLLIIHGTADDNVHFQNTVEVTRALNRAGKQYDMMVYPDQNHSMYPRDMKNIRIKMLRYTLDNL